ncbi:MAG: FHA domain-containing protein [Deltaproteobacteria bacterium]|nr:FHA domain-containing protein [Deltaproteobacteria bacterium]
MKRLVVKNGIEGVSDFDLDDGTYVLGRDPQCQLVIPKSGISRKHAQIEVTSHATVIRDLGSANGTFVNGVLIQEKILRSGDTIAFSDVVFEFYDESQKAEYVAKSTIFEKRTLGIHVREDKIRNYISKLLNWVPLEYACLGLLGLFIFSQNNSDCCSFCGLARGYSVPSVGAHHSICRIR